MRLAEHLSLFRYEFNDSIIQEHECYILFNMGQKCLRNFDLSVKTPRFCHIYATLL